MIAPLLLAILCLAMLGLSAWLVLSSARKTGEQRTMTRLNQGQVEVQTVQAGRVWLDRMLLRAGLRGSGERLKLWLMGWGVLVLIGLLFAGASGLLAMLLLPPIVARLYIAWCYNRRMRRLVEQLPALLDHAVRSLKAGRTLTDAILGAVDDTLDPLKEVMARVQRNVNLGVSLADAMKDLADLYELEELRMLALGLSINHRFGGNASELLENLIKVIRERDQGARQLRAMTGETRTTAYILAALPLLMIGYFMAVNPQYLMHMWNDASGQHLLLVALLLQALGCFALWRMLRSI
ncbi:type II secretion system F family protein [Pseudomonas abieticivorans]|uniref:type II secretion system F family protein n=1 Tax=Pseudomonas abieticivorans TaxID=2931382 RepID=UPI0020C0109B|nr:type II secretion system F family protein [Pseudomonas sp. PIA16]